jgi:hypothetical protein
LVLELGKEGDVVLVPDPGDLPRPAGLLHGTPRLREVVAAVEAAGGGIGGKLRVVGLEVLRLRVKQVQRGKARRVHKEGVRLPGGQKLHVPRGVLSPGDLL